MFQLNHNDLHLNYFGGSGGFLALHLLLLSNYYSNELNNRLDAIINSQWNIVDHNKWKHTETWPDNNKTLSMFESPKLFFYLNKSSLEWREVSGIKLLIYTDLASQLALCKYKKAWIGNISAADQDLNFHFSRFYNNIKDPTWPDCTEIVQSKNLPKFIQNELLAHTEYIDFINAESWEQWLVITNRENKINNNIVFPEIADVAQHSDLTIKLQDILNSYGKALLQPLGLAVLNQHVALIEKWKSLHSEEILSIITSSS